MDSYSNALEFMVKLVVNNPDEVEIRTETDGTVTNLYVKANPSDYGAIIGKGGQMVQNIRKILTVKAVKDGVKINIIIDEEGKEEHEQQKNQESTTKPKIEEEIIIENI